MFKGYGKATRCSKGDRMIKYNHWDIEYQGGDKAITDTLISEAVRRIRESTQQRIIDQHIPISVPSELAEDKQLRERYIEGYIDGFAAMVASFN